ncbi:RlmE family RNA methyltransferase [Parvibaculum sp.]|uniref:RlmE family RNA methyltransferase n=1 Tax=Parvibaculum sp. TaxID=2024848 RepID=UPI002CC26B0D|nr:RlmE family RNA methyltransferase [Parvibaculum sp.]HUD51628.1 RlmE family RNA methyltransferase [Parvibaculum sp.]
MSEKKSTGKGLTKGNAPRALKVRVKTAKKRTLSSTLWLQRQLNDPYVHAAKKEGYRSRAAFKLSEMDDKFHFLKAGARVVDLGAAPGGWCQIAVHRVKSLEGRGDKQGRVIGVDILDMEPMPGATIMKLDFLAEGADAQVKAVLGGEADVVLSDMAAHATGHRQTDHLKIMALCEAAAQFATEVLSEGGTFLAKVLRGGTENELLALLKQHFQNVRHVKPSASRADSAEMYVLAQGFRKKTEESL